MMHSPSSIDWSSVIFTAAAHDEPFEDVSIVTAKAEFAAIASDMAALFLTENQIELTEANLSAATCSMIASSKVSVREYVRIEQTGDITVCLNTSDVNNDDNMWVALDMVARAMDTLDGQPGTVEYGEPLQFSIASVPWVIN